MQETRMVRCPAIGADRPEGHACDHPASAHTPVVMDDIIRVFGRPVARAAKPLETSETYPSALDYSGAKRVAVNEYGYKGAMACAFALGYLASRDGDYESLTILSGDAHRAAEMGWSYFQIYAS